MKKLALKLDDLAVTSFETSRAAAGRGTVLGNAATRGNTCADTCGDTVMAPSCEISCDPSCISTCPVAPCYTGEISNCIC